jgi:type I restriction enzyme M protein
VICRNGKPDSHKGNVLFIDAKEEVTRKNAQSYLEPSHIKKIVDAYNQYESINGFAQKVSTDEIKKNDDLLKIQSYVKVDNRSNVVAFSDSYRQWDELTADNHNVICELLNLLSHE